MLQSIGKHYTTPLMRMNVFMMQYTPVLRRMSVLDHPFVLEVSTGYNVIHFRYLSAKWVFSRQLFFFFLNQTLPLRLVLHPNTVMDSAYRGHNHIHIIRHRHCWDSLTIYLDIMSNVGCTQLAVNGKLSVGVGADSTLLICKLHYGTHNEQLAKHFTTKIPTYLRPIVIALPTIIKR